jgi:hypothetical protein
MSSLWARDVTLSNTFSELHLVQFRHLVWPCSTSLFCRCTVESVLTGNSAAHRTLNYSTHTDNIACWVTCWSVSLCCAQCSLRSLSLSSLLPLCSGNERPRSPYSVTSKRCNRKSLLPFHHSAVPKILQSMSTAIRLQPSWHPRYCFLSPKLSKMFAVTALSSLAPLHTCQHIYI